MLDLWLKRGRLGNGKSVHCYSDRWIGTKNPSRPTYKEDRDDSQEWVADFIDHDTNSWKGNKECFTEEDTKEILKLPLTNHGGNDDFFWTATNQGSFSVNTAYRLAVELFSKCGRNLATSCTRDNIWK